MTCSLMSSSYIGEEVDIRLQWTIIDSDIFKTERPLTGYIRLAETESILVTDQSVCEIKSI